MLRYIGTDTVIRRGSWVVGRSGSQVDGDASRSTTTGSHIQGCTLEPSFHLSF
jgi:hypothetical protein